MTKDEAYKELEQTIGACFGWANREFGGHPSDDKAAAEKKDLIEEHALDKEEVRKIIAKWLYDEGVTGDHLDAQVGSAMDFFFTPEAPPEAEV